LASSPGGKRSCSLQFQQILTFLRLPGKYLFHYRQLLGFIPCTSTLMKLTVILSEFPQFLSESGTLCDVFSRGTSGGRSFGFTFIPGGSLSLQSFIYSFVCSIFSRSLPGSGLWYSKFAPYNRCMSQDCLQTVFSLQSLCGIQGCLNTVCMLGSKSTPRYPAFSQFQSVWEDPSQSPQICYQSDFIRCGSILDRNEEGLKLSEPTPAEIASLIKNRRVYFISISEI